MTKLIPRHKDGDDINVKEEYKKFTEYLNNYFKNNVNKINKETPKKLSEKDDSKRPLTPAGNPGRNVRGVTRTAKNGEKLFN